MQFREDYIPALKACLDGANDWYTVERCFQPHVPDYEIEDGRPVVYAFGYMLVEPGREELRDRTGVFAPRLEWDGAAFPAPLTEIPDEMLPVWASYAEALDDSPVARSRLRDLLWVRRYGGTPVQHAHAAVDAYIELTASWESMRLVECISRALEISVEINDERRITSAVERAVAEIEAEMVTDEWRPGIPLRLLERLVLLRRARRPDRLPYLLEAAADRYGADPFIAQSVSELRAALAPPDDRSEFAHDQVQRWREQAAKAVGVLRYAHLQHALGIARTNGLSDLAEEILQEIQSSSFDELDLKPIGAEISISSEEVEAEVASPTTPRRGQKHSRYLASTGRRAVELRPTRSSSRSLELSIH